MKKLTTKQFKKKIETDLWIQDTDLSEVDFEGLRMDSIVFDDCIFSPEQLSKANFINVKFKRMRNNQFIIVRPGVEDRTDLAVVRGGAVSLIFGLYLNLDDLFRLTELVDIDSL